MIHKVLIVESSSFVLDQYKEALSTLGLDIVVEKDGYKALGRLLKENFDSLVTSTHISTIDGASLVTVLKMLGSSNQNIPTTLIYQGRDSYNSTEVTEALADHCLLNDKKLLKNLESTYVKLLGLENQSKEGELPPLPGN